MTRALLIALAAAALAPAAAHAAGQPLPSSQSGKAGAVAPGGSERFLTRRSGPDTRVLAVRRDDRAAVLRSRTVRGRWSVPAVALNGATTGLSADGGTLVLAQPPGASRTRFAVLDAQRLDVRRRIALPGFYTADAISPDGRRLYVIEYGAGGNPFDYGVRALDLVTGRLEPGEIVDPRNPDEQMGGLPMTRTVSRDGRWAYTLYGGGEETFIHALDTVGGTAACIDLEMLPTDSDLTTVHLRLNADESRIDVRDRGSHVTTVDTRTFAVGDRPATAPAAAAPPQDDGHFPWPLLALVLAGVAVAGGLYTARRQGHRAAPDG
jgi:hypothetical protein